MEPAPLLSFVIPVRNDAAGLERCLQSVVAARGNLPIEVIVGDNGSTDRSAAVARAAGVRLVHVPDATVAAVRNRAAQHARAPLLAFVDADQELGQNWIDGAVSVMNDCDTSAAGAHYHAPPGGPWVQRMYDHLRPRPLRATPTEWLPSGNLVVRRSAFAEVEGFDERLESCEDVDFCWRLRRAGKRLVYAPQLLSVHHGDPRTLRQLFLAELWRGRNNLRVTLRSAPDWSALAGLAYTLAFLVALLGVLAGVLLLPWKGLGVAATAAGLMLTLIGLRVVRLRVQWSSLPRAAMFAAVFDSARALALILSAGHQTRRSA